MSTATVLDAETGAMTPATGLESGMTSGQATPGESDEDVNMDGESTADGATGAGGRVKKEDGGLTEADIMPKGEVFTCEYKFLLVAISFVRQRLVGCERHGTARDRLWSGHQVKQGSKA